MIWYWLELFIGVICALTGIGYVRAVYIDQHIKGTPNFVLRAAIASALLVSAAYCFNDSVRGIW